MEILLKIWLLLLGMIFLIFSSYTLLYYIYSKKSVPKYKKRIFPTISLIIPFFNEEIVIKKKIDNTKNIIYPKNKLSIILLNDYSNDRSIKIIKKEARKLPFKWEIVDNKYDKGKPNALNYILPKIKQEITIITDADSLIKEDGIEILVQNFQNKEIGGANARIVMLKPEKNNDSYKEEKSYRKFYDLWRQGESNIYSISICNGPLMAFRSRLLKDVILARPKGASADDTQLTFFLVEKNYRVIYDKKSIVYEISPLGFFERYKQKMRRARGINRIYTSKLHMLFKGKFGWIIFPYTLLTHVLSPYLVLFSTFIYIALVLKDPLLLTFSLGFFIPKVGPFIFSFVSTQIAMALSPFFARGWNTSKSSREELGK